jgi:c-di-GMP-binding flagellar brake protein YcgR
MDTENIVISSREIDYSKLVGREIRIRTEQFPGQMLSTKILAVTDNNLVIDRSGSCGRIDQLINNQKIEVFFDYKGEPVEFVSRISVPRAGRLQIPIALSVNPQVRRQFVRINLARDVRLTLFDDGSIGSVRLSRMKWLETSTVNISGGGMLINVPILPTTEEFTVLHLNFDDFVLPKLMVGRIRHRRRSDDNKNFLGIEFVVRESCFEKLPRNLLRNLPLKFFDFDEKIRTELAGYLTENFRNLME